MRRFRLLSFALVLLAGQARAVETLYPQRAERSTPDLFSSGGELLAKGRQVQQTLEGGFEVHTSYVFSDGRQVSEVVRMRERPELAQDSWVWEERDAGGAVLRHFEVDFHTGLATGFKQSSGKTHRWSEKVKIEPGRTFSGGGVTYALKNLQPRLARGERVKLKAVGMTPRPRLVTVELRSRGPEQLQMGGRTWDAEHITLHPELGILKLVAHVPDFEFWLSRDRPPVLLRSIYTLLEPGDPLVTADTYGNQPRASLGAGSDEKAWRGPPRAP